MASPSLRLSEGRRQQVSVRVSSPEAADQGEEAAGGGGGGASAVKRRSAALQYAERVRRGQHSDERRALEERRLHFEQLFVDRPTTSPMIDEGAFRDHVKRTEFEARSALAAVSASTSSATLASDRVPVKLRMQGER